MQKITRHEPRTIEEQIVAQLVRDSECVKENETLVLPPPDDCPAHLGLAYAFAGWHPITIIIVFVFLLAVGKLIMSAIKEH